MEPSRFLSSALYNQMEFKTDSIYNAAPPNPITTICIGGIFSAVGFLLWIRRVHAIQNELPATAIITKSLRMRCWLTAYTENDSALFTCIRTAAQSFLLLGGLQMNYSLAFLVMLGFFTLESSADSCRVFLALREAKSLDELVVTSKFLKADLRKHPLTTTLAGNNVYEDLTRDAFVVGMVFVTQTLMIGFVIWDVFNTETHTCLDGTANCPVTGTLGSWGFYVLGIFMACVFLLGPKSNFGRTSQQNPAFWLLLLLSAKQYDNPTYSWQDPVENTRKRFQLNGSQWVRFFLSYLINGVGFHILIHALPIQIAAQSSLTGVVFRAVGMIYLVNLDDTSGYEITMTPPREEDKEDDITETGSAYSFFGGRDDDDDDDIELAKAAEKIVVRAQSKLDSLRRKKKRKQAKAVSSSNSWGHVVSGMAEF